MSTDIQIIFDRVMYVSPGIIWLIITLILIWSSFYIGAAFANRAWRYNIKKHLPKISAEKIDELEKRCKALQAKNIRYMEKISKQNNIIKRIHTITGEV